MASCFDPAPSHWCWPDTVLLYTPLRCGGYIMCLNVLQTVSSCRRWNSIRVSRERSRWLIGGGGGGGGGQLEVGWVSYQW